jgi:divalent metal cation (Fe/Co/Zn/Cd) transporter
VLGARHLRAEYIGPDTAHAGLHIEVQQGMPIEKADQIATEVHERVREQTECRYCIIHVDAREEATAVQENPTAT